MVHFELRYIIYHPLLKVCIKETKHDVVCLLNIHRFTLEVYRDSKKLFERFLSSSECKLISA